MKPKKPEPVIYLPRLMARKEFAHIAGVSTNSVGSWCKLANFRPFRRGQKLDMHQTVILAFIWYASIHLREPLVDYKKDVIAKGKAKQYHKVYRQKFGKACLKTRIQNEIAEGLLADGEMQIAQIIIDWIDANEEIEQNEHDLHSHVA